MPSIANQNPLWRAAFAFRSGDEHSDARHRLENSLLRMSESVEQLLKMVPSDCKGLTLHDISHLDAVWEMASMIAGEDYPLTPAEAYVLGAAILLHDAGLTTASFPGGISDLSSTVTWRDIAAGELRSAGLSPSEVSFDEIPANLKPNIVFATLREIHAQRAERMATDRWIIPGGDPLYLIEDTELRQAFGESIGRVAHSHHWSIDKVASDLRDHVGVGISLPSDWAVSERKLACILRCADAAHIDRRRAPTILFAATKPVKASHIHWSAQNRINKPSVDGSTLVYTAGSSYSVAEADSWWLVYDLIRLVDKEVRSSNALLEELGYERLRVTRVLGADNPRTLSSQIRTVAWQPIDAEIRVSDPIHLALTLGGRNLYGRDPVAPIREIMQNAADAIHARRVLEEREDDWGTISITIEPNPESDESCIVHIDDDGIGMTERVLAGPLIDFGKSIWNSELLRSEFPGLQSKHIRPIGKFGIGFFSIFELADNVRVVSKHYEQGIDNARVLEFKSLSSRPHIRAAAHRELPRDTSTRVSFRVIDKFRVSGMLTPEPDRFTIGGKRRRFTDAILALVPLLDVRVVYHNRVDGTSFEHAAKVYNISSDTFLDEVLVLEESERRETIKRTHASRLSVLMDESGKPYGRAALAMLPRDRYRQSTDHIGAVSVGGFTYRYGTGLPIPYVGVVEGSTEEASRRAAVSRVSAEAVASWATQQGELIEKSSYLKTDLIDACQSILKAGGDPKDLPYCFNQGKLITLEETKSAISRLEEISIVIEPGYGENFSFVGYNDVPQVLFEDGLSPDVFIVGSSKEGLFETEAGKEIFKGLRRKVKDKDFSYSSSALTQFLSVVEKVWQKKPELTVVTKQLFQFEYRYPPDARWIIAVKKESR